MIHISEEATSPQTCGITVFGNILTNTIDTRDVGAGTGIVKNFNTGELFCTIQSAINDAQTLNGHIIEVSDGTYNEQVLCKQESCNQRNRRSKINS
ncbi:MAG: hypothetical protein IPH77_20585 [Ignavibacteria bacterium]|nr:hypothetical protein [Ignavibacteria bacterium]